MPTSEETAEVQITTETAPDRGQMSRRSVLRGAAGAGAAGLAATALAGTTAFASVAKPIPPSKHHGDEMAAGEGVVAHVRDLRSGQIDVYRGNSHVRVHDRSLAAQLARVGQ
jgi:hypothetical protein